MIEAVLFAIIGVAIEADTLYWVFFWIYTSIQFIGHMLHFIANMIKEKEENGVR